MHHPAHNTKSDITGIISSGLCLIHCLVPAVAMLVGANFVEPEGWHLVDFLFLAISGWAIYSVFRGHSPRWIKTGLIASFSLLTLSIFLSHDIVFFLWLGWLAAAGLVVFHAFNIRHAWHCHVKTV